MANNNISIDKLLWNAFNSCNKKGTSENVAHTYVQGDTFWGGSLKGEFKMLFGKGRHILMINVLL